MHTIKRVDPRRPFVIAASGLRRITLGDQSPADGAPADAVADASHLPGNGAHAPVRKPRRTSAAATRSLLVAAHTDRGALDDHARQVLAAAAIVADAQTEVVLVVFGELTEDAGALGADKIVELNALGRPGFAPEAAVAALTRCVKEFQPAHVLLPDNATGDGDLGRRYAAASGASIAAHVVEVDASHVGVYVGAGRAFSTRDWPDVVLLAPDAVVAQLPFVGAGERIAVPDGSADAPALSGARYRDLGTTQLDAAQVALEEADFIISAGNGVADIAAFEALARALGAAIGASRVAVDNGYFTRDKQVGATGKTVTASVYIAFGISGAVQHLQGIKDCRHVIAVNLDASAPIVKRANLTVVGDARATIAALADSVAAARRSASATPAGAELGFREGVAA